MTGKHRITATAAQRSSLMPRMRSLLALPVFVLMCMLAAQSWAQGLVPVPPLQARVTDLAGMLTPDQRSKLESVLLEQEQRTGNQIAILLVNSTAPEAIEQYSIRVADAWKLGRKGIDDGVILLVAKDNPDALRRLRIEAGRGVQGSLTDARSSRILRDVIAPHFRQNDFYGGLSAGVAAIAATVAKEQLPANEAGKAGTAGEGDAGGWWPFLLFAFLMMMAVRRGARGRRSFSSSGWGRTGGIVLGTGLGYGLGRASRGGWGGSGGFGGMGGGGFSGGGGGFDGGGASGNW